MGRQVTAVWQEMRPIRGTILDNLTLGCEPDQPNDPHEALVLARLDAFVDDLPDGVETSVAEFGATLSGGLFFG